MLKAMRGTILVEPMFDHGADIHDLNSGHQLYGLVLPDTASNPESQQGVVIDSRIDEFVIGMHAIYMPYHGLTIKLKGRELLCVPDRELVGWLVGRQIMPRKGCLLIRPEFPTGKTPSGLLYLPEYSGLQTPVKIGEVIRQGAFTTIEVGSRVIMPPDKGFEVGITENLYVLNEQYILAILESHAISPN